MNTLSTAKIALIAAASSVFTSLIQGGAEALAIGNGHRVVPFVLGYVLGNLPVAIVCFGIVYGLLIPTSY